jgi:hypothetical protein
MSKKKPALKVKVKTKTKKVAKKLTKKVSVTKPMGKTYSIGDLIGKNICLRDAAQTLIAVVRAIDADGNIVADAIGDAPFKDPNQHELPLHPAT